MTAVGLFATLTTISHFTMRTFSPILMIAILARLEWVSLGADWLTLDFTIFILVLLSIVEHFSQRTMLFIESFTKPIASFLVSQSLVVGESRAILEYLSRITLNVDQIGTSGGLTAFGATIPYLESTLASYGVIFLSLIWGAITALGVWWLTTIRGELLETIREFDEDDDLGLQKAINWSEEGWVIGNVVITFAFPIVAIGIFLLTLLGIFLAKKYVERLERKSQVPCPTCREPIHASAITCSECRHPNPNPFKVGWLGQPKVNQPITDLNAHRLQLVGRKRCPECATRLKERRIHQPCPTCFTETFANAQQVEVFLADLNQQLPRIMMISFILGFIPLVGIIPGIIYYRFTLIASLRGYVPRATGCLTRWGVRIMNLFLISFQPVPPIGFFVLPLMCLINFKIYEGIIRRESNKTFGGGGGYSYRETPVAQP